MKTDTRKPTEGTRQAAAPSSTTSSEPGAAPDLAQQLKDIEDQERAIAERKADLRKALWEGQVASIKVIIQNLVTSGFDSAQLAKALGFQVRTTAHTITSKTSSSSTVKGPSSNDGWFNVFRGRAVSVYLKQHPDLIASLTAEHVSPSDYASHIPADDLSHIEIAARAKADAKCPRSMEVR
jgi:hypothetical protein